VISFKEYNLLIESFKDAKRIWMTDDTHNFGEQSIDITISRFKQLKDKNQISGQEKDISFWIPKGFEKFREFVKAAHDGDKIRQKEIINSNDAKKIFQNGNFSVYHIKSHAASCKYGAGTKWCITEKSSTHWDGYVAKGIKFYFIIEKNGDPIDVYHKVAVAVYPDELGVGVEVYNALDNLMPEPLFNKFLNKNDIPISIFNIPKPNPIVIMLKRCEVPKHMTFQDWVKARSQAAMQYGRQYSDLSDSKLKDIPESIDVFHYDETYEGITVYKDGSTWRQIQSGSNYSHPINMIIETPEEFFKYYRNRWDEYLILKDAESLTKIDKMEFDVIIKSAVWQALNYIHTHFGVGE